MPAPGANQELHNLAAGLFPICSRIISNGTRETSGRIKGHIPLQTFEVRAGAQVFDWNVPKEWNVRGAYIAAPAESGLWISGNATCT
jgi:aminopeptidase-like protein